jgi:hypothetical protein
MLRSKSRSSTAWVTVLALALVLSAGIWVGCGQDADNSITMPSRNDASISFSPANPAIRATMAVQDRATPELMGIRGVVGTATGLDDNNQPVIKVYTEYSLPAGLPASIDGVPVVVEVTGKIVAMKGKPGGSGVSHTAKQTAPIQLGTSGGWSYDLANGYCCGGTLGALLTKGGKQYILSNYHVFEADIVNGGNNRTAQTGDPIIQRAERGDSRGHQLPARRQRRRVLGRGHPRHGAHRRRDPRGRHPVFLDGRSLHQPGGQEERPHHGSHPEHDQRSQRHHQCGLR